MADFFRRRAFRHVIEMPRGENDWSGPDVSQHAWCHFLSRTTWFDVQPSSLQDCIADDVIPCIAGGEGMIPECEQAEWPISFLPNTAFYDSGARWKNAEYFRSAWIYSILFLNDEDLNAAWQLTDNRFRGAISRVRHFLRPRIYDASFYDGPQRWDLLLFFKSRDFNMKYIARRWPNFTAVQVPYFTYEELRYKAQRSRFCIAGSAWDSYGIGVQEIMAEGCPALVCNPGSLPGNVDPGRQALYLANAPNSQIMGSDAAELETAAREVLGWNRRDVRDATLLFAEPERLCEQWRQALYGELPEHRQRPDPSPLVYCFTQARYVPRLKARCVLDDMAHGGR